MMNMYLYIAIICIVVFLFLTFMTNVGWWLIPILFLLSYIAKIIKGLFSKDDNKKTASRQYYEQDSQDYYQDNSSHQSSAGDIIDADYTVVEEEKTK